MVHLFCAEREYEPTRPTTDADAVVNAREPELLGAVSATLLELGFSANPSADGVQHRRVRDQAVVDVLIPEGTGERTEAKQSSSGFPTVAAPGGTQALHRSEGVEVQVSSRLGSVRRPLLISAMILKAAARTETNGPALERHCLDFAALAAMMASSDVVAFDLESKDKRRLRKMIELTRASRDAMDQNPIAGRRLERLEKLFSRSTNHLEHDAASLRGHRVLRSVGKGNKPSTMTLTVPVLRVLEAPCPTNHRSVSSGRRLTSLPGLASALELRREQPGPPEAGRRLAGGPHGVRCRRRG